ncbi:MAG: hypothetical protein VYA76_04600 [Candidatus Neomarinimicrobiota bacterium]|nr:hypothetical protein [Candidatus Neomarinimicrobiota bacterium]
MRNKLLIIEADALHFSLASRSAIENRSTISINIERKFKMVELTIPSEKTYGW